MFLKEPYLLEMHIGILVKIIPKICFKITQVEGGDMGQCRDGAVESG